MPAIFKSLTAGSGFAIGSRLSLAAKLYSIFALFALLMFVLCFTPVPIQEIKLLP